MIGITINLTLESCDVKIILYAREIHHVSLSLRHSDSAREVEGLLLYSRAQQVYERRHDSFIFPFINKSAGIWLIGIEHECRDCSTSRVPAREAMTSNSGASCLRSCCSAQMYPLVKCDVSNGIRFRIDTDDVYSYHPVDIISMNRLHCELIVADKKR